MQPQSWTPCSEIELRERLYHVLGILTHEYHYITGPGRSGALVAVYASHYLHIPFIPFKHGVEQTGNLLIVDTVEYTGKTLRSAKSWYEKKSNFNRVDICFGFKEYHGKYLKFWYEK